MTLCLLLFALSAVWSLKIDIIENKIYLIQNSASSVAFLALCLQYRVRKLKLKTNSVFRVLILKNLWESIYTVYTRPWFKNQKSITKFLAWIGTHSYLVLSFLLFIINAIVCGYLKKVQNLFHPSSLVSINWQFRSYIISNRLPFVYMCICTYAWNLMRIFMVVYIPKKNLRH